jgi:hypothetical protein
MNKKLLPIAVMPLLFLLLSAKSCKPIVDDSLGQQVGYVINEDPVASQSACLPKTFQADQSHCSLTPQAMSTFGKTPEAQPLINNHNPVNGKMNGQEDITYHNDNFGMRDNTVSLLRSLLLKGTGENAFRHVQHTHGRAFTLYVMTTTQGCDSQVRAYPLSPTEYLDVYVDTTPGNSSSTTSSVFDIRAISNTATRYRVQRFSNPQLSPYNLEPDLFPEYCSHSKHQTTDPKLFWVISGSPNAALKTPNQPTIETRANGKDIKQVIDSASVGYLRRIIIRNQSTGQARKMIRLESGCSAFKICAREDGQSCEVVPTCRLDPADTLKSGKCPNCVASGTRVSVKSTF